MHSRVMMWQPHHSGHALIPPQKGRDVSEDTQVELVLAKHSCEQVLFAIILYFQHFCFIKNIIQASHLMCCYFKLSVK